MNHTPLEDQVHDALARRAKPLQHPPLALGDVRRRARRIQVRRRVAAGVAVAAALAVAVPVGLALDGPARRTEQPPVDRTPGVVGTVRVDPRSASVGSGPGAPLVDVAAQTVTLGDEVVELPKAYELATPFGDGWFAALRQDDGAWTVNWLTPDLEVEDFTDGTSEPVLAPDGSRYAVASFDRVGTWAVMSYDTARQEPERPWASVEQASPGSTVGIVGFVSEDQVLGYQLDAQTGTSSYFVAEGEEVTPYDGIEEAASASPATGMVAGRTTLADGRSCAATFDGASRSAEPLWTDCDRELSQFSPDGSLVAAFGAGDPNAAGDESGVSLLDATTGRSLVDFEVTPVRNRVVGIADQVVWEDDEHLLATYTDGDQQFVVRLGVDGSVERVAGPVTVELGTVGLRLTPGRLSPGRS
ncbi:hypothetical protein KDN32_16095 [Nocardioides sp. J2M5]|uniref:hypothetical protein n=1 Tax=Nocardioides palaemonis TaxID=2829810 RepID=UPI001BA60111|nr:hypothetical protein [Nocardioides palaemonis]MBS2939264.1 hypothetical protein [Nocardioides palaemonis]